MISKDKNTASKRRASRVRVGQTKLLALILKKGERDVSSFQKSFGMDPDFPSVDTIRKSAWYFEQMRQK